MVKSKWGLALSAVVTVVSSLLMSVSFCSVFGLTPTLNGGLVDVSFNNYAPGLKGPPGAYSIWIVRPSVCLSVCLSVRLAVRNSVPLMNKVQ